MKFIKYSGVLLALLLILFLLFIPLLASIPQFSWVLGIRTYFSSDANGPYFEVMSAVLAVLATFVIFYWQQLVEKDRQQEEVEKLREKERNDYLEKREIDFALVRPMFLIKNNHGRCKVELYVRDKVPVKSITIFSREIGKNRYTEKFIGNSSLGQTLFSFNEASLESLIIECKTYINEDVYFQYHAGNNTVHYRLGNAEDIEFCRENYRRKHLLYNGSKYEVYDSLLQNSVYEDFFEKIFLTFLKSHKPYWRSYKENKLLRLSMIVESNEVEEILSRAINELGDYKNNYLEFIELLQVVRKYVEDSWCTNCGSIDPSSQEIHYYVNNITEQGLNQYKQIFMNNGIDKIIICNYIDDLITLMLQNQKIYTYPTRNIELYVIDYVSIAKSRKENQQEIETVLRKVRQDIRNVFAKL